MIVDRPILTSCHHGSHGLPAFADGTPHLTPHSFSQFASALRDDLSLMEVEPARRVFRRVDPDEPYPVPESCTPFLDANGTGFYLKPRLPIVFVRNRRGEPLLEARTGLKYLRENADRFAPQLDRIAQFALTIFKPGSLDAATPSQRLLFCDVVQPYNAFTGRHLSLRCGLWAATPPGVSTMISAPINQPAVLPVISGAIETDWHHFELFVVVELPEFDGQVLVIEPGRPLAQLHFVARATHEHAELRFSRNQHGAEPDYAATWEQLGNRLATEGKGNIAERHGTASVEIGCPHCFVSVTAAADGPLPDDHVATRGFNRAYKILQHEHRARRAFPRKLR
jgi:hypothetical protein